MGGGEPTPTVVASGIIRSRRYAGAQVEGDVFPGKEFSPYRMHKDDAAMFERFVASQPKARTGLGKEVAPPRQGERDHPALRSDPGGEEIKVY